ncbi:ELO domain-containing protein [Cephalotus follicularis]|uniref:ELO domain-containing protein n=1 Tax=Cephalotus follicularis TaxID=3775 RepID=A0A1Q3AZK6_CEPFO|nr:ELO domain-containing protein [Cephalotus follicularis]
MTTNILSTLQYWLVDHPKIQHFSWAQGENLGSSWEFLLSTILTYLSLTFLLSNVQLPFLKPQVMIKPFLILHNINLLVLSFTMALGCTLSIFSHLPNVNYIICFPKHTKPTGPLFFWTYIFYLSKILEFLDTLLIIFSNSINRLTFLHVYHHATVLVMCYLSLYTSESMFSLVLVTNSSVHMLMYTYYLSCALGVRPKWKRLVTDCQIVQFWSSFFIMLVICIYHFTGEGCSGIWGWFFNAVFISSLLVLFTQFYSKNYSPTKKKASMTKNA